MIDGIRNFFNRDRPRLRPDGRRFATRAACRHGRAAAGNDAHGRSITAAETASVTRSLQRRFGLEAAQVDTLMALAAEEARLATDYFQFTSLINKNFSAEQKVQVVEYLWQVAYADGHLDAHEQHFMRKIADLLYVSHADYVGAKQRAREKI
jgi:uncharacterized tellurite resistance protein B-like protein